MCYLNNERAIEELNDFAKRMPENLERIEQEKISKATLFFKESVNTDNESMKEQLLSQFIQINKDNAVFEKIFSGQTSEPIYNSLSNSLSFQKSLQMLQKLNPQKYNYSKLYEYAKKYQSNEYSDTMKFILENEILQSNINSPEQIQKLIEDENFLNININNLSQKIDLTIVNNLVTNLEKVVKLSKDNTLKNQITEKLDELRELKREVINVTKAQQLQASGYIQECLNLKNANEWSLYRNRNTMIDNQQVVSEIKKQFKEIITKNKDINVLKKYIGFLVHSTEGAPEVKKDEMFKDLIHLKQNNPKLTYTDLLETFRENQKNSAMATSSNNFPYSMTIQLYFETKMLQERLEGKLDPKDYTICDEIVNNLYNPNLVDSPFITPLLSNSNFFRIIGRGFDALKQNFLDKANGLEFNSNTTLKDIIEFNIQKIEKISEATQANNIKLAKKFDSFERSTKEMDLLIDKPITKDIK